MASFPSMPESPFINEGAGAVAAEQGFQFVEFVLGITTIALNAMVIAGTATGGALTGAFVIPAVCAGMTALMTLSKYNKVDSNHPWANLVKVGLVLGLAMSAAFIAGNVLALKGSFAMSTMAWINIAPAIAGAGVGALACLCVCGGVCCMAAQGKAALAADDDT